MSDPLTIELIWWVTVVELPALAGLFWLNWRTRRDSEDGLSTQREALAAFKLDVARDYASIAHLKDVEKRLTAHLVRIEQKLDTVPNAAARSLAPYYKHGGSA